MIPTLIQDLVTRGVGVSIVRQAQTTAAEVVVGYTIAGFYRQYMLVPEPEADGVVELKVYRDSGIVAYSAGTVQTLRDVAEDYVSSWKEQMRDHERHDIQPDYQWLEILKEFDLVKTAPVKYIPK